MSGHRTVLADLAAAGRILRRGDTIAWLGAALLPLGAFAGFVVSCTVGLPGAADDVGNWRQPLGLAALFVEGALVALAASVLYAHRAVTHVPVRPRARAGREQGAACAWGSSARGPRPCSAGGLRRGSS